MKNNLILLVLVAFIAIAGTIDLNVLENYEGQPVPNYITKDNGVANPQNDAKATLGRVLFYDKRMSLDNSIACASCHQQEFAFSDTAQTSIGFDGGLTDRHSMRLINTRFSALENFFWDKRADDLEDQTTQPIQNAVEMGFSGTNGQPDLDSLIRKLQSLNDYNILFDFVYGDTIITEVRIQESIANFVRSIQSFDSKFDVGLAQANGNVNGPFTNYSPNENAGKALFIQPPNNGGAGCVACHQAPEFDIDPNTLNNGIIGVANVPGATDLTNHRSPTLRDLFNPDGELNGSLMHSGELSTIQEVIEHYNLIQQNNQQLDPRLGGEPQGQLQDLGLTAQEKLDLEAFLKTLSGNQVYTNEIYSDPFDENGNIEIIPSTSGLALLKSNPFEVYPNPFVSEINIRPVSGMFGTWQLYSTAGGFVKSGTVNEVASVDTRYLPSGVFILKLTLNNKKVYSIKLVK